LCEFL